MNVIEIIEFLKDSGLTQVEEIEYKDDILVLRCYYDFDKDEIIAAKSFATEESDYELESEEWYSEYLIPYLNDIAVDNLSDIVEETMDEFEVEGQFSSYDIDRNNFEYSEFILAFSDSEEEIDIDNILDDIDL